MGSIKKRRVLAPGFNTGGVPINPMTGAYEQVQAQGIHPFCALMQVAADDNANYVICRGFDTRIKKFIDYQALNPDKPGIPVAKPYGSRHVGAYVVGEVHAAVLPINRLGQNPLVAADTEGHPADLEEVVDLLYTDEGIVINWMLISEAVLKPFCRFTANDSFDETDSSVEGTIKTQWGRGSLHTTTSGVTFNNFLTHLADTYLFEGDSGDAGIAQYSGTGTIWYIVQFECP